MADSPVIAVVDGPEHVPVVWWVSAGPGSGISRLCGAWVLDTDAQRQHLRILTNGFITLPTADGLRVLREQALAPDRVLDPAATLAAVTDVRDELQDVYEHTITTARSGRTLVPPSWPRLPEPLDLDYVPRPAGDPRASRAFGIAQWLMYLADAWADVEEQRLSRRYLHAIGGDVSRNLPLVYSAPLPTPA